MTTNKNRASHTGECQICGSRQMLPNGRLAKHGYTTKWGFFSGTCTGSEHLPFELSTDRIADAVAIMEKQVAATEKEAAERADFNSERNATDAAIKQVYPRMSGGSVWAAGKVVDFIPHNYGGGEFYTANFLTDEKFWAGHGKDSAQMNVKIESYAFGPKDSIRFWVHTLNTTYAEHLRRTNSSRKTWLKWQAERLANWSVKPLQPRK